MIRHIGFWIPKPLSEGKTWFSVLFGHNTTIFSVVGSYPTFQAFYSFFGFRKYVSYNAQFSYFRLPSHRRITYCACARLENLFSRKVVDSSHSARLLDNRFRLPLLWRIHLVGRSLDCHYCGSCPSVDMSVKNSGSVLRNYWTDFDEIWWECWVYALVAWKLLWSNFNPSVAIATGQKHSFFQSKPVLQLV